MNKDLLLNGKQYISASRAAKNFGYAQDYIGYLIRSKKIEGKMIGRSWYVDLESLIEHKQNKKFKTKSLNSEPLIPVQSSVVGEIPKQLPKLKYESETAPVLPPLSKLKYRLKRENLWKLHKHVVEQALVGSAATFIIIASGIHTLGFYSPQASTATLDKLANVATAENLFVESIGKNISNKLEPLAQLARVPILSDAVDEFNFIIDFIFGRIYLALNPPKPTPTIIYKPYPNVAVDQTPVSVAVVPPAINTNPVATPVGTAPTIQRVVTYYPFDIQALKNELRGEFASYVDAHIASLTTVSPQILEIFRTAEVAQVVHTSVSNQSTSDVMNLLAREVYNVLNGGIFLDSSITGATIKDSTFSGSSINLTGGNFFATNSTTTTSFSETASSTNLFSTSGNIGSLVFNNATGTSATTTNLFSTSGAFLGLSSTNSTSTNAVTTNATITNANLTNGSIANLLATFSTTTSATSTNFFSTKGTFDNLFVNTYEQNSGTFAINSSVATGDIFSVLDNAITSGTLIHQSLTSNAGNGQTSKGQVIDLTDNTVAGGGYKALTINITGTGIGSGNKYLLDLNPGSNAEVVFDNMGAFRPTTSAASNTNTIGSPSFYWKNGYFDTLTANNLSGTVVSGATSNSTWTIGSTQTGDVNEGLIFQRNSGSGNATLEWNKGANDLRYLSVNYPFNSTYTVSDASISTTTNLYSGLLTNNTSSGTQKLLSLTNTGTGTTENGIYINNTGTGATAFEIAGTWTNGILTNNNSINTGSGNITSTGTGSFTSLLFTNATSTNFFATNLNSTTASSTNLFSTNSNLGVVTSGLINGQTISSAANFTGTLGVSGLSTFSTALHTGSTTLQSLTFTTATATSATTTNFFSTNLTGTNINFSNILFTNSTGTSATTTNFFTTTGSTTNLFSTNSNLGVVTSGLINGQTISSAANFTGTLGVSGLSTFSTALHTGSTTLQSFTFTTATGTSATTTNFFSTNLTSTTASTTNLFSSLLTVGSNALVVTSSGNVGVGNTGTAGYKFDISGSENVSGPQYQTYGTNSINLVVPGATLTTTDRAINIGKGTATGVVSINIGHNSSAAGTGGLAIGYTSNATNGGIAIASRGLGATTDTGISIGGSSSVAGIAINGTQSGSAFLALGGTSSGANSVSIGSGTLASGNYSVALGDRASATHTASFAMGLGSKTTAANQFVAGGYFGGAFYGIGDVYFGSGPESDQATTRGGDSYTINGSGGFGIDQTGGNITIAGGKGTGTGAGGNIYFSTASALTSGSTLQSLSTKATILGNGNFGIGTTSPFAKLSVAGDAYIGGNLTATGTLAVTGLTTLGNAIVGPVLSIRRADTTGYSVLQFTTASPNESNWEINTTNAANADLSFYNFKNPGNALTLNYDNSVSVTNSMTVSGMIGVGAAPTTNQIVLSSANTTQNGIDIANTSAGGKKWRFQNDGSAVSGRVGNLEIWNLTDSVSPIAIQPAGNVGIGTLSPTAVLHLKAGTTAANSAPLKFTSGALLTTAEAGAVEFLTDAFYGTITTGAARKTFAFLESPSFTTPNIGAATGSSLNLGAGAITSGLINGQTISSAASLTGTLAVTGLITATGSIKIPNATYYKGTTAAGGSNPNLIGVTTLNSADMIQIDPSGYGVVIPSSLNVATLRIGAANFGTTGIISSNANYGLYYYAKTGAIHDFVVFSVNGSEPAYINPGDTWLTLSSPRVVGTILVSGAATLQSTLDVTGAVTGGTYNGQTISSAANFTGTVAAAGFINANGGIAVSGGGFAAGTITTTALSGLRIGAVTGSSSDFNLYTPGGSTIISVPTGTQKVSFSPSATGYASINLGTGVAPTSPVNGDIWSTGSALFTRVSSQTAQLADSINAFTFGSTLGVTGNFAVNTNKLFVNSSTGFVGIGTVAPVRTSDMFTVNGGWTILRGSTNDSTANTLNIENLGGTAALIARNDGFIGIGVATPHRTGSNLSVTGFTVLRGTTADATASALYVEASGGGNILTARNDGNVGIGKTDPGSKLEVQLANSSSLVKIDTATNYNSSISDFSNPTGAIWFTRTAGGTYTNQIGVYDPGGGGYANTAYIAYNSHVFANLNGEAMRICGGNGCAAGYVGIGTTTPLSKLAVSGSASIGANYNIAAPSNGLLVEGNVGIGTTTPATKLSVVGNTDISGSFTGSQAKLKVNSGWIEINAPYNGYAALRFVDSTGVGNTWQLYPQGTFFGFYNGTTGVYNMSITNTGNVGIGVTGATAKLHIVQTATTTGAATGIVYTGAINTNQTLSTEIPAVTFTTAGRQWATGAITTQREVLITQPTYSFVGASTITDAATVGIAGAPIAGTNATLTNSHALLIQAGAVAAGTTNSYGLTVNAQTGATNNFAAAFLGGNVGVGTTTPNYKLDISTSNSSNVTTDSSATIFRVSNTASNYPTFPSPSAGIELNNGYATGIGARIVSQQYADHYAWTKLFFQTSTAQNTWSTAMTVKGFVGYSNVGIGTTDPTNTLHLVGQAYFATTNNLDSLSMQGNASYLRFNLYNTQVKIDTGSASQPLILQSTYGGSVGIGTSTPVSKLSVSGSVAIGSTNYTAAPTDGLSVIGNTYIGTTTAQSARLTIVGQTANSVYNTYMDSTFASTNAGSAYGLRINASNQLLQVERSGVTQFNVSGNGQIVANGPGTNGAYAMLIDHSQTTTGAGSGNGLRINAAANGSGATLLSVEAAGVAALTVLANGNVGIGTSSPVGLLDVGGWVGKPSDLTSSFTNILTDLFIGNDGSGVGRLRQSSNANQGFMAWNSYYNGSVLKAMDTLKPSFLIEMNGAGGSPDSFQFKRAAATSGTQSFASLMTILGGGNVGIGTSGPSAKLHIVQTVTATGALTGIVYTGAINTNQTLSTEIPAVTFTTAGRQWATGAITTQREVLITQPTYSFVGASTITDAATVGIAGAPIASTNATLTNSHGLLIQAGAVAAGTTNSYGLTVNAQTGATNNYAAAFLGGNVGIGTTSPLAKLDVDDAAGFYTLNNAAPAGIFSTSNVLGTSGNLDKVSLQVLSSDTAGINVGGALAFSGKPTAASNLTVEYGIITGAKENATDANNAGYLAFRTRAHNANTAEAMRITSAGNVGIGSTSPYAKLTVKASGTGTGVNFQTTNSSDSPLFTILDSGNVGIGTASPAVTLDIVSDTQASERLYTAHATGYPTYAFRRSKGTALSPTANSVDDTLGIIYFQGQTNGGVGGGYNSAAISGAADTGWGSTGFDTPGRLVFHTASDGSSAVTERMRINSLGNVGIGTTTPGARLHSLSTTEQLRLGYDASNYTSFTTLSTGNLSISPTGGNVGIGTATPDSRLDVASANVTVANGTFGNLNIYATDTGAQNVGSSLTFSANESGSTNKRVMASIEGRLDTAAAGTPMGYLVFRANTSGGAVIERMRITSAGYVGIGTSTPSTKFSVGGAAGDTSGHGYFTGGLGVGVVNQTAGSLAVSGLVSCGGVQTNAGGLMSCTSDARLKDIKGNFTSGLDSIRAIQPQFYSWKPGSGLYDGGVNYYGFIAQNIEGALPEAVNTNPMGYKQINTTSILAAAINAIKELDINASSTNNRLDSVVSNIGLNLNDVTAGLHVDKEATFNNGLKVDHIGSIGGFVLINSDVEFIGRPFVNSDTTGTIVVEAGDRQVDVVFDNVYPGTPSVTASISLEASTSPNILSTQQMLFDNGVSMLVTNRTATGFSILLNKPAPTKMSISWIALASKVMRITNSSGTVQPGPSSSVVIVSPTPTSTSSVQATSTPTSTTTTATSTPTATTTPTVISTSTTTPIVDTSTTTPII